MGLPEEDLERENSNQIINCRVSMNSSRNKDGVIINFS
jgi:hypothetical protein